MRYFDLSEFDCPGSGENRMEPDFLELLDELRHRCGFAFVVTSGYRSPEHNAAIGGSPRSQHLLGRAADIAADAHTGRIIVQEAFKLGGFNGIGINLKGSRRFIHLDNRLLTPEQKPVMWSY